MILVDANILLYAEDQASPLNEKARKWWDDKLSGDLPVCLTWPVVLAYIRIATNRRIFEQPLILSEAIQRVQGWLDQPCVRLVSPTSRHWEILQNLLSQGQAIGNLVSDAHLAALSIEHGLTLCSTDRDFARFKGLRWENPLVPSES